MKKKIKKVWLIIVTIMVVSIICPNYTYAIKAETISGVGSIGGKLLGPIMEVFVALCDGVIDISQKALFGVEGDAIVEVDRTANGIAKVLGVIAAIAVLAGSVALAIFFAPVTGVVATVAVGVSTAVISIGKVIKTYFVVSVIASSMLNTSFDLPFIVISPEDIIQNKIGMFNVNFFGKNENINENDNSTNIADELHLVIAKWYYTIRNIVIVLFMILLIYTGIRIVLTSVSEDKAKYKKMLTDWLMSFCLLFLIHYIMVFSMNIVEEFTQMIAIATNGESVEYLDIVDDKVYDYVKENLVDSEDKPSWSEEMMAKAKSLFGANDSSSGEYSMLYINEDGEKAVRFPVDNFITQARIKEQLLDKDTSTETYVSVGWKLIYVMLTLFTIRFGWIYLKRVVYIAFLILIAPVVVLTYSVDKFRDGQAQGFNMWLREYLFNLAIQPFHLVLYTVFVGMAMSLASKSPIYVIVVLGFISQAETILRNMFGFQKASTPGVLSGAFGTGVAMSAMQKLFGRKPAQQPNANNYLNKTTQSSGSTNSRITGDDIEVDIDDDNINTDESEDGSISSTIKDIAKNIKEDVEGAKEKSYENETEDSGENESNRANRRLLTVAANNIRMTQNAQNPPPVNISSSDSGTKKKAKLKLGKALKGAGRHYIQSKGRALANKAMSKDLIGDAKKAVLGGAAALTAGTAGVILGAVDGNPEKAVRNAMTAGAFSYKGVSNMIGNNKVEGMSEAFKKAGYGDDYKIYQNEIIKKEIKRDLEKREKLVEEFHWDRKELNKFLEETIGEYIDSGVKQFDDMVIGEKLKLNKVAKNTKEAIGIMSMAQKIGSDTTKLTEKKKQEWAETFMNRNAIMSEVQKEIKKKEKEYNKQIEQILNKKLDKSEEQQQINVVKSKMNSDKDLNALKKNVQTFQVKTFEKLDKYSEYKYKE